jgi:hypothetical protein
MTEEFIEFFFAEIMIDVYLKEVQTCDKSVKYYLENLIKKV